ncbi:E3 ubiquitin-protein ligase HECTD3-like [Liolophura sinensis]|uniref:E3 ubiquitin-protein ligase HECTD3-like n=1 Tax=Liolophura sinensis TaxID=3198878 RepID=UPI0031593D97
MSVPRARRRLARIRCLQDCADRFQENEPLPRSLCFVPSEVHFKCPNNSVIPLYSEPNKAKNKKVQEIICAADAKVIVSGEEFYNNFGKWVKGKKYQHKKTGEFISLPEDSWILLISPGKSPGESPLLVPAHDSSSTTLTKADGGSHGKKTHLSSFEEVVEYNYSLKLSNKADLIQEDVEAVNRLCQVPVNWSLENDEALVKLLCDQMPPDNEQLGSIKNYVDSIDVSSFDEDGPQNLTDGDPETYWESDGSQGQHWIKLHMKKGVIIKKLCLTVDTADDNYLPVMMSVMGGEPDTMKLLNTINQDWNVSDTHDICVLENLTEHYPIIMIKIQECKAGGIDTRIHGITIKSTEERVLGFSTELFTKDSLVRYPKLEPYSPEVLFRRALLLHRFVTILDSVLPYIVPAWEYSVGSYDALEALRQLLPLSKKRLSLIDTFLRDSSLGQPSDIPKLYINRREAMEHRCDPSQDPEYKHSIFTQMYEGLKPRDRFTKPLDYRWPSRYDQWWECKFLSEGIIDQGGGFRDSLSDLSEELCPSSMDTPVPLPFFIRSPNQSNEDSNVNKDVYIPNPSCKEFQKYEWIGQLMGACLRGKENLILSLPSFVWKKLSGEKTNWQRDFFTVDAAEVKLIDILESMEESEFNVKIAGKRTWSTFLSDGTVIQLKISADGTSPELSYTDRGDYCQAVKKIRMAESDLQIQAIKQGLLKVVPQAVLDLLTWQELEKRICGDPEITLEALRGTVHYDDLEETDMRVKYLWEALKAFSNEDRSRFLRFVTGRRRLPAPMYVCQGKGDAVDVLPESSTCGNILYLPSYSSGKVAEENIRYAAYNCVAIDTDMFPWDE